MDDVLRNVTGDDKDGNLNKLLSNRAKDRLAMITKVFEEGYWTLVGAGQEVGKELDTELEAIVAKAKCVAGRTDLLQNEKVLKLLALIFA